jgi:hypothetical protein
MADNLVLVSDVVDQDKDGNQIVVGEYGKPLPDKLSDLRDEYIDAGILVPKAYLDLAENPAMAQALVSAGGLDPQAVRQMSKADLEAVQATAEAAASPNVAAEDAAESAAAANKADKTK